MENIKKELLESLEAKLKEDDGIGEMSLFTAQELGAPMDVLRAEVAEFGPDLVSVLGEFFFIPFEDEELLYFTTVLTLSSTVPKEAVPDVAAAVARLNYYLPCGCYALGDDDQNLIFRCTALIDGSDDREHQAASVSNTAFASLSIAEKFLGYLLLVLKNEISVNEMVDMMKGGNVPE